MRGPPLAGCVVAGDVPAGCGGFVQASIRTAIRSVIPNPFTPRAMNLRAQRELSVTSALLTSGFFSGGKDSGGWKAGESGFGLVAASRAGSLWSGFGPLFWLRRAAP